MLLKYKKKEKEKVFFLELLLLLLYQNINRKDKHIKNYKL